MERFLRVSEVARELGISAEWLRVAEATGNIPRAQRDINGWRVYTMQSVEKIRSLLVPSDGGRGSGRHPDQAKVEV